jgi:hypothetical protein
VSPSPGGLPLLFTEEPLSAAYRSGLGPCTQATAPAPPTARNSRSARPLCTKDGLACCPGSTETAVAPSPQPLSLKALPSLPNVASHPATWRAIHPGMSVVIPAPHPPKPILKAGIHTSLPPLASPACCICQSAVPGRGGCRPPAWCRPPCTPPARRSSRGRGRSGSTGPGWRPGRFRGPAAGKGRVSGISTRCVRVGEGEGFWCMREDWTWLDSRQVPRACGRAGGGKGSDT